MNDEDRSVFTRERYDEICKRAEELGITIVNQISEGSEEYKNR